ncbi:hypothetical protein [Desulfobulbus elongatus]|uniref:hypothetical protein n=1 Tax=Desulfobulbus elongatus TaxID=53332 RepID=UPI0012F7F7B9|nr:hypothetical protein [Desulfobulbus elongatus]
MSKSKDKDDIAFINMRYGMKFNSILTIPSDVWRSNLSMHAKILYILISEYEIDTRHWRGSRYECRKIINTESSDYKMKMSVNDFNYYIGEMVVDYISSLEKKSSENLLKKSAQELIEMELVKVSK